MRKKEQRLWDLMRKKAPADIWLQRVENMVGDGMPDVHVAARPGRLSWVELKAPIAPSRPTTPLFTAYGLRQSQVNWLVKAASMQLPAWVLVKDSNGRLYLVPAEFADDMNRMGSEAMSKASVADNWDDIFQTLRNA